MDDKLFGKLITKRKITKNIIAVETPGYEDDKKTLHMANHMLRSFAQNIIEKIDEHRHLKSSNILLLVKTAESDAKKLQNGEIITIGEASRANPKDKLLSCIGNKLENRPDFIVWLSGDYLDAAGATGDKGQICTDDEDGLRKALALIDHELLHCGVKIAGEFVKKDDLDGYVQDLGIRHVETCEDIERPDGSVLVRFYHLDKTGNYVFKMRKHDIEEFHGVVKRHGGRWCRQLGRLIDILVESEQTLFETAK